jgi:CBS-domain-containing membrane protein
LTAVLVAPNTIENGFFLVLAPVVINSVLLVATGIICNRALGRLHHPYAAQNRILPPHQRT